LALAIGVLLGADLLHAQNLQLTPTLDAPILRQVPATDPKADPKADPNATAPTPPAGVPTDQNPGGTTTAPITDQQQSSSDRAPEEPPPPPPADAGTNLQGQVGQEPVVPGQTTTRPPPRPKTESSKASSSEKASTPGAVVSSVSSRPPDHVSVSSSSRVAAPAAPIVPETPPPRSFFDRDNFGYDVPIIDAPLAPSGDSRVLLFNLLLALLTALLFGITRDLLDRTLPNASPGVHLFLRRLPLSLAIFLALLGVRELLFPTVAAQGMASASPSPTLFVSLYALLFFVVAGITNFVCNNLIGSEAHALEQFFFPTKGWKRSKLLIFLFFLLYAAIGAHINTSFSLVPTLQTGIAFVALLTIIVAAYAKDGFRYAMAKHREWGPWLEANAVGLLFALLSVWLTRKLNLSPGYLFGVPAGVFIVHAVYSEREGPFEWAGLLVMLVVAFIAWLLLPFTAGAQVVHDFLKLLVVILVEACFFESLPFTYLAGGSVYRWRRLVWALQCTLVTFLVLQFLWNPSSTVGSLAASPPALTYVLLLCVYAIAVLGIVLYCRMIRASH
jgi:hypothetical protein